MENYEKPYARVVGSAPEETKEQIRGDYLNRLFSHYDSLTEYQREILRAHEYPKSELEKELLFVANNETSQLMREAGVEPFDIPEENFHIVPNDLYSEIRGKENSASRGMVKYAQQGIFLNRKKTAGPFNFLGTALHEALHLKGHVAFQFDQEHESKSEFRTGLTVLSALKKDKEGDEHVHFVGLHEAVVAGQTKKSFEKIKTHPALREELGRMNSEQVLKEIEEISEKEGIIKNEIYWYSSDGSDLSTFGYYGPRKTLDYVCGEIQKEFPDKYPDSDSVFKEFLDAQFTGKLLPIGRLVEKTFGEGSFRRLGDMGKDDESAYLCREALQKMRVKIDKEV